MFILGWVILFLALFVRSRIYAFIFLMIGLNSILISYYFNIQLLVIIDIGMILFAGVFSYRRLFR